MLLGKKIVLGVCGSIAAYKAAILIRLLVKEGAEVKVVMTSSAHSFITPLTLATLSKQPVFSAFYNTENGQWVNHVELGLWADIMVIAPASAHTLGKMASGICDNLLLSVYLSARCPVVICPAMDLDMYAHPSTQKNLQNLRSFGNHVIEPATGELASGLNGQGRMTEPEDIVLELKKKFDKKQSLTGKNILITAGPTYEPLDPVRFIGNHSSGKMGYSIARAAGERGGNVTLISGPVMLPVPGGLKHFEKVMSAEEMYNAAIKYADSADIIILAAAVADFTPRVKHKEKYKKKDGEDSFLLELVKTIDIAATIGKSKRKGQVLVGFALESENEEENAKKKLLDKNLDLIVLNSIRREGAGFGHDTNVITIIDKAMKSVDYSLKLKKEVAEDILNAIGAIEA